MENELIVHAKNLQVPVRRTGVVTGARPLLIKAQLHAHLFPRVVGAVLRALAEIRMRVAGRRSRGRRDGIASAIGRPRIINQTAFNRTGRLAGAVGLAQTG